MSFFTKKTKCPYCKLVLDKPAKRKKKCPHCGKYIFVRNGKMFTNEDAKALDWVKKLEGYGVTKRTFSKECKNMEKQFNQPPSTNDVIWRILNKMVVSGYSIGYHFMAVIAREEGKDTKPYTTEVLKQTLVGYRDKEFIGSVRIYTANDNQVCESCRNLHDKVFSIEEALETLPIPTMCTNDICRCYYQPIVSEESLEEALRKILPDNENC